ncbi:hypothetical protein OSTOST_08943, partial [Ostertagia ostertagi]
VLTSFWDFYATMQDIRALSQSNEWEQLNGVTDFSTRNVSMKGLSLLRPIKDRNCKEAGIPDELCMCRNEIAVDIRQLGNEILRHLNNLLASSSQCAKLTLARILHATVIEDDDDARRSKAQYRVTVEAKPSGALLEALLKYDRAHNTSTVYRNVNRVNAYGNQSSCVYDQELRKFCYCISD